jgi:ankyrin repeat protein
MSLPADAPSAASAWRRRAEVDIMTRNRTPVPVLAAALALMLAGLHAAPTTPDAPVADAAMRGDTDAVRELVRGGSDVNAAQGDGMTALHWSALNGDLATMNVLLPAGATTEPLTRIGRYTPLHLASSRGHAAVVGRLLDAGSKPAALTATGVQPIHLAAQAGDPGAVAALLAKGAEVNVRDETHGRTPLLFAASHNRAEAIKVLLDAGADITLATNVIDYPERSQEDGTDRQARSRLVAAQTGREPQTLQNNSLFNNEPPPAAAGRGGRAGAPARQGRGGARGGGGRGAAFDPDDPDLPPDTPRGRGGRGGRGGDPNAPRPLSAIQQIGRQGGFTALHYAARDGYADAATLLLDAGLDVNVRSGGDESTPMLVAIINGHYDLARSFLARGANPNLASDDGAAPLFAVLNNEWALRTWYPQPTAQKQQQTSHLQMLDALLEAGADPNARVRAHIWYAAYNAGRMGIEFTGATAFWRAAYALDVEAMRLLVRYGADPSIATMSYGSARRPNDQSGMAAMPPGGPHVPPFHAASGVGYGTSRVAQQHRHVPDGWLPAAKYFLEELGVDVNMRDADGFTALHHAAARGDNEMILYLVSKGADVMAVNRGGQTTVDMANSPEQRTQPFPATIKLLEGMGAKNNHNCRACG